MKQLTRGEDFVIFRDNRRNHRTFSKRFVQFRKFEDTLKSGLLSRFCQFKKKLFDNVCLAGITSF